jgi:cysteine dioxygenase
MSVSARELPAQYVSIDDYVAELHDLPASAFDDVFAIHQFQRHFLIRPESLNRYLFWDVQHYTRNLIDRTPLYELIAICWEIGQASSVHNHHNQNCWMAAPIGRLLVQNYRTIEQNLATGQCRIEPAGITEMNAESPAAVDPQEPVHKVFNPREFGQRAVSVHIYSRPFDSCIAYSEEKQTCGEIELVNTSEFGVCKDPRVTQTAN